MLTFDPFLMLINLGNRYVKILNSLLLATVFLPAIAEAKNAQASTGTIIVTANRTDTPLSEVGQSVTVISIAEIEARQSIALVDLLRTVPGVTFTRNGGLGTTTAVNIRGADSDQTLALIDGVKVNDPSSPGSGFNFGNLLTGNISRIEVVRGSQSVLWGSQAIGGVVNVITREPTETPTANLQAEYGWRDTSQVVGNLSGKFGPVSASIGAGYLRSNSFSVYNEARGATERDGYTNDGANAKFNIVVSDMMSIDLRGRYSSSKVDVDGFAPPTFVFGDTKEASLTKEWVGYAGLNLSLFDGKFRNRFAYSYTGIKRENKDLSIATPVSTFDGKGDNQRLEYQGNVDIVEGYGVTFGVETETSSFRTSSFGGPVSRADAKLDSIYSQLTASRFSGLTLTAGVRYDYSRSFGGNTVFAASAVYSPNSGLTTMRASYGEGFKAPSLFQLFSNFGNKTLKPESSQSWDASITQKILNNVIELGATWFHRNSNDQIVFISCTTPPSRICVDRPFGTYDNVSRTRAEGLEFGFTLKPIDTLMVRANYSWIDTKNRVSGLKLARRPRQSINASIDYKWANGLNTGATIVHIGDSFDDAANKQPIDGYALIDLRARYPITSRISIYGRIENLFDEQYETNFRYGTPRRAAYVGLRLNL
jgi:vitamin B12 transporter